MPSTRLDDADPTLASKFVQAKEVTSKLRFQLRQLQVSQICDCRDSEIL